MNLNQKIATAKKRYPVGAVVTSANKRHSDFTITEDTQFIEIMSRGLFAVRTSGEPGTSSQARRVYMSIKEQKDKRVFGSMVLNGEGWAFSSAWIDGLGSICQWADIDKMLLLDMDKVDEKVKIHINEATSFTPQQVAAIKEGLKGRHGGIWIQDGNAESDWAAKYGDVSKGQYVAIVDGKIYPNQDVRDAMAQAAADKIPGLHDQEDKPGAAWPRVCGVCESSLGDQCPACWVQDEARRTVGNYGQDQEIDEPINPVHAFYWGLVVALGFIIFGLYMAAKFISEWQ